MRDFFSGYFAGKSHQLESGIWVGIFLSRCFQQPCLCKIAIGNIIFKDFNDIYSDQVAPQTPLWIFALIWLDWSKQKVLEPCKKLNCQENIHLLRVHSWTFQRGHQAQKSYNYQMHSRKTNIAGLQGKWELLRHPVTPDIPRHSSGLISPQSKWCIARHCPVESTWWCSNYLDLSMTCFTFFTKKKWQLWGKKKDFLPRFTVVSLGACLDIFHIGCFRTCRSCKSLGSTLHRTCAMRCQHAHGLG